jgi:hypothetical protein
VPGHWKGHLVHSEGGRTLIACPADLGNWSGPTDLGSWSVGPYLGTIRLDSALRASGGDGHRKGSDAGESHVCDRLPRPFPTSIGHEGVSRCTPGLWSRHGHLVTSTGISAPGGLPRLSVLERRLQLLADRDPDFLSFVEKDDRELVHLFFQYPAMMVPRLQRAFLEECITWDPSIQTVYDPFVGSGTVLTEAMLLGRDFVGGDINPLAVLVCRAKADLFDTDALDVDLRRLIAAVDRDTSKRIAVSFPNIDKWFQPHVQIGLSRLHRAIGARRNGNHRRFWWVALAETVRLSSNSRTSTVKLHLRPQSEIDTRPDPVALFKGIAARNLRVLREQQHLLAERQLLDDGRYVGTTSVHIADVRDRRAQRVADMVMTSPPYGDNHTTVTYGQASYLPLQWIDRSDIARGLTHAGVESTHRTDTNSLGGHSTLSPSGMDRLLDRSPHLRRTHDQLKDKPRDRWARIAVFYKDVDASLGPILDRVRPGGLLVWTTGDRSVGGIRVPMTPILRELLGRRTEFVSSLERTIPLDRKRMASRNAITSTMGAETILVLRKRAE